MCAVIHVRAIETRQAARHRGQTANKLIAFVCVLVHATWQTPEYIFHYRDHFWGNQTILAAPRDFKWVEIVKGSKVRTVSKFRTKLRLRSAFNYNFRVD